MSFNIFHKSFEATLLVKFIDGIVQIMGGLLLVLATPDRIDTFMLWLADTESSNNLVERIENYIINIIGNYNISSQFWGIFFLVTHGTVNLALSYMLWKKKIIAYPVAIVILFVYIFYQLFRYSYHHSIFLIILTIWDIVTIVLTWIEYKKIKKLFLR